MKSPAQSDGPAIAGTPSALPTAGLCVHLPTPLRPTTSYRAAARAVDAWSTPGRPDGYSCFDTRWDRNQQVVHPCCLATSLQSGTAPPSPTSPGVTARSTVIGYPRFNCAARDSATRTCAASANPAAIPGSDLSYKTTEGLAQGRDAGSLDALSHQSWQSRYSESVDWEASGRHAPCQQVCQAAQQPCSCFALMTPSWPDPR